LKGEKNNLKEDIVTETLGSNTIIRNVGEIVKEKNKQIEVLDKNNCELKEVERG
jgi:hypothetical protein